MVLMNVVQDHVQFIAHNREAIDILGMFDKPPEIHLVVIFVLNESKVSDQQIIVPDANRPGIRANGIKHLFTHIGIISAIHHDEERIDRLAVLHETVQIIDHLDSESGCFEFDRLLCAVRSHVNHSCLLVFDVPYFLHQLHAAG